MKSSGMARRTALYATLLTAGIGQPLLQLYGDNQAVFTSARMSGTDVIVFALVVLLAPVCVLAVFDLAAGLLPMRLQGKVRHGLVAVSALPLGMMLVRSLPGASIFSLGLALLIAVAVTVVQVRIPAIRTWITWMSPLAGAVLVLFVVASQSVIWPAKAEVLDIASATTTPSAQSGASPSATAPKDVSVLWLQLDEAPLWPLLGSDGSINARRFPGFAALAQNSTWYRNALGLSQTTVDAVPAMLTGKKPVTGKSPTYSNYRKNLFALMYGHRALDVHEIATALCPKEACATVSVSGNDQIANAGDNDGVETTTMTEPTTSMNARPGADLSQFFRDALVVFGHKLLPRDLRDRLPAIDEGWGGFGNGATSDTFDSSAASSVSETANPAATSTIASTASSTEQSNDTVPPTTEARSVQTKKNTVRGWERDGAKSQVPVVQDMVSRAARSSLPTVHFAHVLLPHRPWQLTPDLRTTRFVATDPRGPEVEDRVRDEYQAFLAQYVATDRVILEMVTAMKKSANWDRTMIIVTSDHGIAFEPGESKRKDINPERTDTLEEIYRVPLFVKWPDQTKADIDDCAVQGFDILPMVVSATGMDAGWSFDGVNVHTACPSRTTRTIWWDKGSTTVTSGFDSARMVAQRFSEWVDQDSDVDGIAKLSGMEKWFNVRIPSSAVKDPIVRRWSTRDRDLFTNVASSLFGKVPLQFDGVITTSGEPGDDAVGLVVMDGRVVAVIPELSTMRAGSNPYRSIVLPSALTPGRHQPVLYVGRGSPDAPQVTLVGAPR